LIGQFCGFLLHKGIAMGIVFFVLRYNGVTSFSKKIYGYFDKNKYSYAKRYALRLQKNSFCISKA